MLPRDNDFAATLPSDFDVIFCHERPGEVGGGGRENGGNIISRKSVLTFFFENLNILLF